MSVTEGVFQINAIWHAEFTEAASLMSTERRGNMESDSYHLDQILEAAVIKSWHGSNAQRRRRIDSCRIRLRRKWPREVPASLVINYSWLAPDLFLQHVRFWF